MEAVYPKYPIILFELALINCLLHPVHKAIMNNLFKDQTDLILKSLTQCSGLRFPEAL